VASLESVTARMTQPGTVAELYGEPNRFGGRPVVARIERRPGGYAVKGPPDRVRAQLADAVADLTPDQAASDRWEFASG
jgi:hypothetical protein